MKFSAAITAACLAITATALPADADAAAPARTFWGNPIIDHKPVPGTRRSPTMHIIDKIPVPEERRDATAEVERRGAGRTRPVVDHRPVERRAEGDVSAEGDAEESPDKSDSTIAKAFWGMPIIDHTPVPGTRRRRAGVEGRGKPFPVVDHTPVDGN